MTLEELAVKRTKLIAIVALGILLFIVVLQNTETVETRFLFASIAMPRAMLMLTMTLIGFALGVLSLSGLVEKKGTIGQ